MLRLVEVLEPVLTEVAQADLRGPVVAEQLARRLRHEHLAAVPGRADARRTWTPMPDVALAAHAGLARVDAHAHAQLGALGPGCAASAR